MTTQFTAIGLKISDGTSFSQWKSLGREIRDREEGRQWVIGDWLRFASGKWDQGKFKAAVEEIGIPYNTAAQCKRVSDAFPEFCLRRQNLPWSHYKETATLDADVRKDLLESAAIGEWSVEDLKREIALATKERPPIKATRLLDVLADGEIHDESELAEIVGKGVRQRVSDLRKYDWNIVFDNGYVLKGGSPKSKDDQPPEEKICRDIDGLTTRQKVKVWAHLRDDEKADKAIERADRKASGRPVTKTEEANADICDAHRAAQIVLKQYGPKTYRNVLRHASPEQFAEWHMLLNQAIDALRDVAGAFEKEKSDESVLHDGQPGCDVVKFTRSAV